MLKEFIEYLETQVRNHSIYVWGAQGQMKPIITEDWIKSRETSTTNANRAIAFWKKQIAAGRGDTLRAFDCSGLGMYFLQNMNGLYKSDMTSNSMMGKCRKIAKSDLKKGDWVFRVYQSGEKKGQAYHIGYVVDDALNIIEAKGRDDGVVKQALNASGTSYWNYFGRPSVFSEEIDNSTTATNTTTNTTSWTLSRLLKKKSPMMKGTDVKNAQAALIAKGHSCGVQGADGVFGFNTANAVRAFQKAHGLVMDGIIGKNTCSALGGTWKV